MRKKGQITFFIIIGIVLLVSFGVFIYLKVSLTKETTEISINFEDQKIQLSSQIENCIQTETKEAVFLYGVSEENEEIIKYLEEKLDDCVDFNALEEMGLEINKKDIKVNVNAGENYLGIDVNYPITMSKETSSSKIEGFNYNMEIKTENYLKTKDGFVLQDSVIELKDAGVKLEIPKGTLMLDLSDVDKGKEIPRVDKLNIEVKGIDNIENSKGIVVGEEVFDLKADDIWFYPAIKLTIEYEDYLLPKGANENNIKIIYYEKYLNEWVELETQIDKKNNLLTAEIYHFTPYSIGVPGQLKEKLPDKGIVSITGAVVGSDDETKTEDLNVAQITEDIIKELGNAKCYEGDYPEGVVECAGYNCNAYNGAFPTEKCYEFKSKEFSEQICPGDYIMVPWSCKGNHFFRCCVRPNVYDFVKDLVGDTFSSDYNELSDDKKVDFIRTKFENVENLDTDELVMLSVMIVELIKEVQDGQYTGEYINEPNFLEELVDSLKIIKHYLTIEEFEEEENLEVEQLGELVDQRAISSVGFIDTKVGDSIVRIKRTTYIGDSQFKFLIIHDDENVAPRALHEILSEYNVGGVVYELESGNRREISFKYKEKICIIDPNRAFTPEGRSGKISPNCNDEGSQNSLIPLTSQFLGLFGDYVIVLHNNGPGGFGINSYSPSAVASEVYRSENDPDDFIYVTRKGTFDYFKSKGYNVILQKPGLRNQNYFSENGNDGSMSVAVDTTKDYINIEAEGKDTGHLDFQREAILDTLKHLSPGIKLEKRIT